MRLLGYKWPPGQDGIYHSSCLPRTWQSGAFPWHPYLFSVEQKEPQAGGSGGLGSGLHFTTMRGSEQKREQLSCVIPQKEEPRPGEVWPLTLRGVISFLYSKDSKLSALFILYFLFSSLPLAVHSWEKNLTFLILGFLLCIRTG